MKNSWLKKSILILLILDAIIGTVFGIHIYLSNDIVLFEKYYLLVFYAAIFDVIAVIYLIVRLIISICKAIKAKRIAIAEEKARLEEERRKELERKKAIEAEKKRIAKVKEEINNIISQYKTAPVSSPPVVNDVDVFADIENDQAVQIVKQYKADQTSDIKECIEVDARIDEIININKEPDDKLDYLKSNIDVLDSLKSNSDELHLRTNTRKIIIDAQVSDKSVLGSLLDVIGKSEKCVSDKTSISDLITYEKPAEYSMFSCSTEPTILKYVNVTYCVFDNIILVFDRDGVFLTAIKPSSLILNFKKHSCFVEVTNDCIADNEYIGKDSKLIRKGETSYSWLYMRKDGMPDRRHTYNPCFANRKDKYEYGVLSFQLLDTTFRYSFSSQSAVNHALELSYRYDARKYDKVELCEITYMQD